MTDNRHHTAGPGSAPSLLDGYRRNLPLSAPLTWLRAGLADTLSSPVPSLVYGLVVCVFSVGFIAALVMFGFSYIVLPAIAGFMVVGPVVAVGLYEKSRRLALGQRPVRFKDLIRVRPKSPGHLLFVGVFLLLVLLFWLRTGILLYALFFGLQPAGGLSDSLTAVFFTTDGRLLLVVGTLVGGTIAAFAFAASAFSVPMLMNEPKDTITAMTISLAMALANWKVALVWGCLVAVLFLASVATGLIGLIAVFPLLGHSSWHAYLAMRTPQALAAASGTDG